MQSGIYAARTIKRRVAAGQAGGGGTGRARASGPSGVEGAGTADEGVADVHVGTDKPFVYRDLGSMATISRFRAIVSFKGLKFGGFFGWLMWAFVHLTFLTGFKNRGTALLKWLSAFVGSSRDERTITMRQVSARVLARRAGIRPDEESLSRFVEDDAPP